MDELRFDTLTRAFACTSTRRAAFRLIGGALAGVLGVRRVGEASGARGGRCATTAECGSCLLCEPGRNGRPGKCVPDPASEGVGCGGDCGVCKNGRCLHADDLCADCDRCDARTLTCVSRCPATQICCDGRCRRPGDGFCAPPNCVIDGTVYLGGGINPNNTCQSCVPTKDSWTSWNTMRGDGEPCSTIAPLKCINGAGFCLNGECVRDPLPDGEFCGDGQECCKGVCCGSGAGCGDNGCVPGCMIETTFYPDGEHHPTEACLVCSVSNNASSWSSLSDTSCGENADQVCCGGVCCGPGECCALDQVCEACDCQIDGQGYSRNTLNPANACEICDPDRDPGAWSPDSDVSCGPSREQVCCEGVCCGPGACCALDQVCEACACIIDGQGYSRNTLNPVNECEICDPGTSTTAWSADSNASCGSNRDQVCCSGACCGPDECCIPDGNCESCEPDCTIDSVDYAAGSANPNDACEVCDPAVSTSAWTTVPNDSPCGNAQDRVCCRRTCCGPDECCFPEGGCGACNPGCMIDGVFYQVGTENPANDCQYCLLGGGASATSWTNRSANLLCGPDRHDHCCNGVCCEPAACCNAAGVCEIGGSIICGGCAIDGVDYRVNEVNPADPCQVCDSSVSPTSWTSVCSDTCCAPLFCIHDGGSHCGVPD